jgi:hypothetical protein
MKKLTLLTAALVALTTIPAHAGVKEIGTINGLKIVRIKTCGVFAPSSTTVVYYDPAKPGTIEGVLNHVGGPGVVPACATAGGIVGGAALLRPARVNNTTENSTVVTGGNTSSTGGSSGPGWIPPGHVNNPSQH